MLQFDIDLGMRVDVEKRSVPGRRPSNTDQPTDPGSMRVDLATGRPVER